MITLTIDGIHVTVKELMTVLNAAREAGIEIPTLCDDERLKPIGACRMCFVEIEGVKKLQTACTTAALDGMVIRTKTNRVTDARRVMLELLLINHPLDCPVCDKAGECKLQDLAIEFGPEKSRFIEKKREFKQHVISTLIDRDLNRCVLCKKCVRICDELQGVKALGVFHRGGHSEVGPFHGGHLDCEFCGHCISVCPVGALTDRVFRFKTRVWNLKEVDTVCSYCGCGCLMTLGVQEGKILRVITKAEKGPNTGSLCVKGRFGFQFVNSKDRLSAPLIRKGGKLVEVGWDEAMNYVSKRLTEVMEKYGRDSIAGIASVRCTNEENYLFQKFMRATIGTNNVDSLGSLDLGGSFQALRYAFGIGAMTNPFNHLVNAKTILVIGSNTTEENPIVGLRLKEAARENDAKMIVANTRDITLNKFASIQLRYRPGTEVVLINGIIRTIIEEGHYDKDFISSKTRHFEELNESVKRYTPEFVEEITGVARKDLLATARAFFGVSENSAFVYGKELSRYPNGKDNVTAICNLALLTKNIGKKDCGIYPLMLYNNSRGAFDLGCLPCLLPGFQEIYDPSKRKKFEDAWGVNLPQGEGLEVIDFFKLAREGPIRAIYVMGANPAFTYPDGRQVEEVLKSLDFLVVQDIFLNETAKLAHVVLPSTSFAEKEGTFTNMERRIQRVKQAIEPIGNSKPDWRIISELSTIMGYKMEYDSPSEIMDEIAALAPIYGGVDYKRLESSSLQWPCPREDHPGTEVLYVKGSLHEKANFKVVEYSEPIAKSSEYPLTLVTGNILYHSGTLSRKSDALNGVASEGYLEINPEDAHSLNLNDGDPVRLRSKSGSLDIRVKITMKSPPGVVFVPSHYEELPVNQLMDQKKRVIGVAIEKIKDYAIA